MDLKQLMLGDLVHIKLYRPDENLQPVEYLQPVRIEQIGGIVMVKNLSADKEPYQLLESTEIEQIPLTHEIMAKNFDENKGRGYFYFDDFIELYLFGKSTMVRSFLNATMLSFHLCLESKSWSAPSTNSSTSSVTSVTKKRLCYDRN